MIGVLPESLYINGKDYRIRTDFRNVLMIFEAMADQELSKKEKWIAAFTVLFYELPAFTEESYKQVMWFLNCGREEERITAKDPLYNWKQDEGLIFAATNKVAGMETRSVEYMHYWTFMGYFQEIGRSLFAHVVSIRDKLNKKVKLDKAEKEFYNKNINLIKLKRQPTKEDLEMEEFLKKFI